MEIHQLNATTQVSFNKLYMNVLHDFLTGNLRKHTVGPHDLFLMHAVIMKDTRNTMETPNQVHLEATSYKCLKIMFVYNFCEWEVKSFDLFYLIYVLLLLFIFIYLFIL